MVTRDTAFIDGYEKTNFQYVFYMKRSVQKDLMF